jgi:hypothetical protein
MNTVARSSAILALTLASAMCANCSAPALL